VPASSPHHPGDRSAATLAALLSLALVLAATSAGATTAIIGAGGNLEVDGQPFFPIGMYHVSWIGDRQGARAVPDLATIADAGFNLVHPTVDARPDMRDLLDAAVARGVYVIGEVPWPANGPDGFVNLWKAHPAIVGWNVADDFNAPFAGPPHRLPAEIQARSDVIEGLAPGHLTYASGGSFPGFEIASYAGTLEVMGFQSYPVAAGNSGEDYWLEENMDSWDYVAQELAGSGQLFVATPQAFKWSSGTSFGPPQWPSPAEVRNMAYAPLTRGAKGMLYYTFWGENGVLADKNPPLWSELARETAELRSLTPFLLHGSRTALATGLERVHGAYWEHAGQVVVVLLNTHREDSYAVALDLPPSVVPPLHAMFPPRAEGGMSLTAGQVAGGIGPEEVHVYVADVVPPGSQQPVAAIEQTPARVAYDEPITLDASASSDPDGTVVAWDWDLGGELASGAATQVTYDQPGTYHVRLTVRDDQGTPRTAFQAVEVGITSLCEPAPIAGCRSAGRTTLKIADSGAAARRRVVWQWRNGETDPGELGDPSATTEYALCVYDPAGNVLATGARPDPEKWKERAGGFTLKDRAAVGGVHAMRLKPKPDAKASLQVKGKGERLPAVGLPMALPLTVQLVTSDGPTCWEATYDPADVARNDPKQLKARSG